MFTQELGEKELQNFSKNLHSMIAPVYYLLGETDKGAETTQRIRREIASSAKLIAENIDKLAEFIERYAKKRPRFTDIYWNEFPMIDNNKMNDSLEVSLFNQVDSLRYIFKGVYDLVFPLIGRWNLNSLTDDNEITALTLFESSCAHIEDALGTLNNILDNNVERAGSFKFHSDYGFMVSSAPINVGELFYESVVKDSESVILTSATLANSDGTKGMAQVEWMTGYNLLPSEKRFRTGMFLDNNYDYENNANVFLCTDVPSLYDQNFVPDVMEKIIPIIRDLGGRTLLLFSARVRFDKACEFLLKAFEGEIPLFIQGLGLNVVEDFKKSSSGILIGMESFSEGIDIPGEKLEFIYIDKVPDLRQDLVIQKRRDFYEANFGNEFNDYFLAHRTRSLHQKLGRLIRRENDRGCIIITDSRLARWKGRTLESFKDMMKPYKINITDLDSACEKTRDFLL
jgi:ATP-dependent DNA helicase DinG